MIIPKLNARDKKRILAKVNHLIGSPLFDKAIKELREQWGIKATNIGLKTFQYEFYGKLMREKKFEKFQNDIYKITEKFSLPRRYETVVYQHLFFNSIKYDIDQLFPIRILPFSFNSENSDGERVVCLHLYGDTIQEDYIAAWPSVKKYLDGMMLTGKELNRKNFIRDQYFFETKLNSPDKTDANISSDYEKMTGEIVYEWNLKVARKRYEEWTRKYKHVCYDGYAEDLCLYRLKQANPNATASRLANSFYKKTGQKKTAASIKQQLSRLEIYRRSNIKS